MSPASPYSRNAGAMPYFKASTREETTMTPVKIVGILLIVLGALGLAFGSFSYTKETHQAKIGPLQLSVEEKERINVPQWAGLASIAVGIVLLVAGRKK